MGSTGKDCHRCLVKNVLKAGYVQNVSKMNFARMASDFGHSPKRKLPIDDTNLTVNCQSQPRNIIKLCTILQSLQLICLICSTLAYAFGISFQHNPSVSMPFHSLMFLLSFPCTHIGNYVTNSALAHHDCIFLSFKQHFFIHFSCILPVCMMVKQHLI